MKKYVFLCLAISFVSTLLAQPVYTFKIKVGIDRETINTLGGFEKVKQMTRDMFKKVNRAFNYNAQFVAIYNFELDYDAMYIYDGPSNEEIKIPHPKHDFLVIIDGLKTHSSEVGGGWNGGETQAIYHSRTYNDNFNDPFNQEAIDGIIHEFGHARGVPDIYAMTVDGAKNPINGQSFLGIRCVMNYPYKEDHWCKFAVNLINLAADKKIEIDSLVANLCPSKINIIVLNSNDEPVKDAIIKLYPVKWYSYSVTKTPHIISRTSADGICSLNGNVYGYNAEFGLDCVNFLVEAEWNNKRTYGWLPLYEVQNARFEGKTSFDLKLIIKENTEVTNCDLSKKVSM